MDDNSRALGQARDQESALRRPLGTRFKYDIFLSYAREDLVLAEKLNQTLTNAGLSVWYDRNLMPGDHYPSLIKQRLEQSKKVAVLWTATSTNKEWVYDEASSSRSRLIPIVVDGATPPPGLGSIHAINVSSEYRLEDEQSIIQAVGRVLTRAHTYAGYGKFTNTIVTAKGLLDLDEIAIPYLPPAEARDGHITDTSTIFAYTIFPSAHQICFPEKLSKYTTAVAFCIPRPSLVAQVLEEHLDQEELAFIIDTSKSPGDWFPERKNRVIHTVGLYLYDYFIIALSFPRLSIGIDNKPTVSYRSMTDAFLLPLLKYHRTMQTRQVNLRLLRIGSGRLNGRQKSWEGDRYLLKKARKLAKAVYPAKKAFSAKLTSNSSTDKLIIQLARLYKWAVDRSHSSGDSTWLDKFEAWNSRD